AVKTARQLYADAQLLLANERWPRAAALAVLCLEEVGKLQLLPLIHDAADDQARRKAWEAYRSHPLKSSQNAVPGQANNDEHRRQLSFKFGQEFDQLKQLAFYSNWLDSGAWVRPDEVITQGDAELVVTWAGVMVEQLQEWERVPK
ncbi:MAG: AbiV family abortive infection protein, partial [Thioalkalivibrio sp.]|nr:AbiV family abortive infection protein [Thioalkalivibrio sp.]